MKKTLAGTKQPKVGGPWHLSETLPDPRRPALRDVGERNIFFKSGLSSAHTTLAVNDTQTQYATEMQRVRTVEVAGVSGGTVTVQVQVDGRDLFDDTQRPVSDAGPKDVTDFYLFPAGTPVSTVIEATTGTPTGTASVLIDTEPYVLLPKLDPLILRGKARMFSAQRREARARNVVAAPSRAEREARLAPYAAAGAAPLAPEVEIMPSAGLRLQRGGRRPPVRPSGPLV